MSAAESGRFRRGIILGVVSALGYSISNLALRPLSDTSYISGGDLWVPALKGLLTAIVAWLLVSRRLLIHRESALPPGCLFPALVLAAILMQFGENLAFQVALGHIGLAITVPLVFARIICVGAVLGRILLHDLVTMEVVSSMVVIFAAICPLSYGTVADV